MSAARLIHAVAALVCLSSLAAQTGDAFAFRRGPVSLTGDGVGPVLPDTPAQQAAKKAAAAAGRVRLPKPVDPLKEIRNRMVTRQEVSYEELQLLADRGDDLAAYFLARRIEEAGDPELLDGAAHYYARSAYAGRAAAIRPLVKLIDAHAADFKDALLGDLKAALEVQAKKANAIAVDALARYYLEGTPFGSDPERAEELLRRSAEGGNAQIALDFAVQLLSGGPSAEEKADALRYLELAALSDRLGVRTMAENLLREFGSPVVAAAETAEIVAPVPATRQVVQ